MIRVYGHQAFKAWFKGICLSFVCSLSLSALAYEQVSESEWRRAKDLASFQPYLQSQEQVFSLAGQTGRAVLTDFNDHVNILYMLNLSWGGRTYEFNLENPNKGIDLKLSDQGRLLFVDKKYDKVVKECDLFGNHPLESELFEGLDTDPYVPLCEKSLYLRNQQNGRKENIELAKSFLRDFLPSGLAEGLINFAKNTIFKDKYLIEGSESEVEVGYENQASLLAPPEASVSREVEISNHGIDFEFKSGESHLVAGRWYEAAKYKGVYLSTMKPNLVSSDILNSYPERVRGFDGVENTALVASVAIDLNRYTLGWSNGTEHPGVGWSSRARNVRRPNPQGPDGFSNLKPLEFPGVVSPLDVERTIATFAGGFQRHHSAFKWGPLSEMNYAHHYGFMEKGVLMSTLVPNLATVIIHQSGHVELKTWEKSDEQRLPSMKDVRQNGVPLIERNENGQGIPGEFVRHWGPGNWSGSAEAELRTPRTSVCVYKDRDRHYLILSYFTGHTPNSMARVLQSYNCQYAVHLDMNHPLLAYAAFFTIEEGEKANIEHLHKGMDPYDVKANGQYMPRSLLTPNYKDFFYIMKR